MGMVADSRAALEQQVGAVDEFLASLELDDGEEIVKGHGPGGNSVSYRVVAPGVREAEASAAEALAASAAGGGPAQAQGVRGKRGQASNGIGHAAEQNLDEVVEKK